MVFLFEMRYSSSSMQYKINKFFVYVGGSLHFHRNI
jgi:hypothetical protein